MLVGVEDLLLEQRHVSRVLSQPFPLALVLIEQLSIVWLARVIGFLGGFLLDKVKYHIAASIRIFCRLASASAILIACQLRRHCCGSCLALPRRVARGGRRLAKIVFLLQVLRAERARESRVLLLNILVVVCGGCASSVGYNRACTYRH